MSRILILIYGVAAYFIGVAGLVAIIAVLAQLMPWGFLRLESTLGLGPILFNILLVTLWGLIHSVMARATFKDMITRVIPEPAERATYCLVAGLASIALTGWWQHVPGQVWSVEMGWAVTAIWGLFWLGWVFTLASTFAINHFDLFGLRQVYLNFKNQERAPLPFVKRAMYQYIRHPIQTGVLIGVWATPSMSATQIILSIGFTAYIFVGLWYEERDLVKFHGDEYRQYMGEAGKLFPRIRS